MNIYQNDGLLISDFKKILIQSSSNKETRVAIHYSLLNDIPIERSSTPITTVSDDTLPIGTVEFLQGAINPDYKWYCYPAELSCYLGRQINILPKNILPKENHLFIKPVKTKLFTGFVLGEDYEEECKFLRLPDNELVYCSNVVNFDTEYRFYIKDKKILGYDWYLANNDDPIPFNELVVNNMIKLYDNNNAYALDVGVLKDGTTLLVEVNDAWAIGLYNNALSPKEYINWLWSRWKQIRC